MSFHPDSDSERRPQPNYFMGAAPLQPLSNDAWLALHRQDIPKTSAEPGDEGPFAPFPRRLIGKYNWEARLVDVLAAEFGQNVTLLKLKKGPRATEIIREAIEEAHPRSTS